MQGIRSDRQSAWKVCNIIQEVVTKTIPKKKKREKAKWFYEETLKTAEESRESRGKGESKRYTQMNAVFKRITKRKEGILKWTMQRNRGKQ